jgi:hypothetical protein
VKAANPDAKVTEISKILGAQWALLTQAQKDSYKVKA